MLNLTLGISLISVYNLGFYAEFFIYNYLLTYKSGGL